MKLLIRFSILVSILAVLLSACATSPTNTPTPRPVIIIKATKTLRPTATQTKRPVSLSACVTNATIRIRRGPGTDYEAIGGLVSGTCMSISGRNQDSTWAYMVSDDNKTGWVAAPLLTIDGNLNRVSVRTDSTTTNLLQSAAQTALATKPVPTATRRPVIVFTNTPRPVVIQPTTQDNNCSPAYPGVCIPPRPPDLDCKDIPYRRFAVRSPDPHGFDGDGDGIGCES